MKKIITCLLLLAALTACFASCAPAEYRVFDKAILKDGVLQNETLVLDIGNGSSVCPRGEALVFFRTENMSTLTVNVNFIAFAGDIKGGKYAWEGRVLYDGTIHVVKGVLTAKDVNEQTLVLPYDSVSDIDPGDLMTERLVTQSATLQMLTLLKDMDAYLAAKEKKQTLADFGFTDFYKD